MFCGLTLRRLVMFRRLLFLCLVLVLGTAFHPLFAGPKEVRIRKADDGSCVDVPESVEIYAANGVNPGFAKSKKAEWKADQRGEYYWEVVYKGDGDDLLGPIDPIDCSERKTKSKDTDKVAQGNTEDWVYKIVVHECDEDGQKGAFVCETDPIIVIKGGP